MEKQNKSSANEYRNEGLLRWEAQRVEWLRPKSGNENKKVEKGKNKPPVNAEDIAERIFSQSGWQLSEPVSLSDMVDILIDFWEAEGLYD